jgi:mRNA-degrading endonuclease RelE of RelBE toxin-antitoxin system
MFKVSITSSAERDLKRLDRPIKNGIVSTIPAVFIPGSVESRLIP